MKDWKKLLIMVTVFVAAYFVPFGHPLVADSILEAFHMLQEYAREHVLHCLVPALFIAGAIANFLSQGAVMQYFGAQASKWVSYSVASVSGVILAVCSCTVLPLFAGIYRRGAGLGPAIAFLYSGPAINLLAIILTARILGWELGVARAIGAIVFAIVIGLLMALMFRKEEAKRAQESMPEFEAETTNRSALQNVSFFLVLVLILVFAAWSRPADPVGFFNAVWSVKWYLTAGLLLLLTFIVLRWFKAEERRDWVATTWEFSAQILPLLFAGVLVAGLLMGRPESDAGLIPAHYIAGLVGGNSIFANLFASVAGAFMYFATLTEVPILQGLLGAGMGQGPALALLLAGPALSLPNILVIRSVLGNKKTLAFVTLVVVMATLSGLLYGSIAG